MDKYEVDGKSWYAFEPPAHWTKDDCIKASLQILATLELNFESRSSEVRRDYQLRLKKCLERALELS